MNTQELKDKIDKIRLAMFHGLLSYDEAKLEAKPIIDEMNRRGSIVAQKYGKKFRPFSFAALMR